MAKNESTRPEPKPAEPTRAEREKRFPEENELTDAQIVQRRTPDVDGRPLWPADGRFHRSFNVETPRVSSRDQTDATSDWRSSDHDAMHEANKVAVLNEALNLGLHPRGEATFDGAGPKNDLTGTVALTYSVEVVPASSETPEETAALTFTPSKALAEQGGTTLPDDRS
jgi:hypothetical protein